MRLFLIFLSHNRCNRFTKLWEKRYDYNFDFESQNNTHLSRDERWINSSYNKFTMSWASMLIEAIFWKMLFPSLVYLAWWWGRYLLKYSLIKHTCSGRDKPITQWILNKQVKIFYVYHWTFVRSIGRVSWKCFKTWISVRHLMWF